MVLKGLKKKMKIKDQNEFYNELVELLFNYDLDFDNEKLTDREFMEKVENNASKIIDLLKENE
jgi:predicted RNA-binding protein with EMAP domain